MNFESFNPDGLNVDELKSWQTVFEQLAKYCQLKQAAHAYRIDGQIVRAKAVEMHCDFIYSTLPADVKW